MKNEFMEKMSMDELQDIIDRTEYAESGVALFDAGADQDLCRAAKKEIAARIYGDLKC